MTDFLNFLAKARVGSTIYPHSSRPFEAQGSAAFGFCWPRQSLASMQIGERRHSSRVAPRQTSRPLLGPWARMLFAPLSAYPRQEPEHLAGTEP